MNRAEIIKSLVAEGFSEKTLAIFNDSQLQKLSNKILKEAQTVTTTKTVYNSKDTKDVAALNTALKDPNVDKSKIEVKEDGEKWIQKAINPKKKGQLHKDLGVPSDEKITKKELEAASKKKGKVGQRARMALNLRNLNEFVENAAEKNFHSLTTKGEIVSLVKERLNESDAEINERMGGKLPEFMSFDSIVSTGEKEAPEKEAPEIDAPPAETPDKPDLDPRRAPFRNPNTEPAPETDPKAKVKKLHKSNQMPMAAE